MAGAAPEGGGAGPKPRGPRPDFTERKEQREKEKTTVVRVKLNGLLTENGLNLDWEPLLKEVKKAWWHGHVLANQVVAQYLAWGLPCPILDQGFFQHVLQAVNKSWDPFRGKRPIAFIAVAEAHRAACKANPAYSLPDLKLLQGFQNNAAFMMATNAKASKILSSRQLRLSFAS